MRLIDTDKLIELIDDDIASIDPDCESVARCTLKMVKQYIKALPTIEVESLTDKEQRIFLAAMAREEKVCKEVDEECRDCREPYEDSLVKTCHEITRKVKSVLWT